MAEFYLEAGVIGVVVVLFSFMVMNIIKSLKMQNEDIDQLRQDISKMEAVIDNSQSIVLKLVARLNAKDAAESVRADKSNELRSKSLERFATSCGQLERLLIKLDGKLEGRWSIENRSSHADRR